MNAATQAAPHIPQIRLYQDWLAAERGLHFDSYDALWRWSTTELDAFWQSIWDYFDLRSPTLHSDVLERNVMPGANWFPGAQVNYAQQVFRHVAPAHAAGFAAVISRNEKGHAVELSWPELQRQVASLALHLQAQGVQPGDRVAAYLPNIPETMVAFLATVSIGGVWSVCAPDMGTNAVLDRFKQIEPKVLIACDGVTYGGQDFDRLAVVAELRAALPTVTPRHSANQSCRVGDAGRAGAGRRGTLRLVRRRHRARRRGRGVVRAALAAVRPPAVDRLQQRHHRPAQAHRARPRRHGHRRAGAQDPAQRRGLQLRTPTAGASATTGTAPPAG